MPHYHYPVVQPDGRFAIYSSIVDAFTFMDMAAEDALKELMSWHRVNDPADELAHLNRMAAGEPPKYAHWHSWDYLAAWVMFIHNLDGDENQREAIVQRTPPSRMELIMQNVQRYFDDDELDEIDLRELMEER